MTIANLSIAPQHHLPHGSSNGSASGFVAAPPSNKKAAQDEVSEMLFDVANALDKAVREIHDINGDTKVLALNARIEAARAGSNGAAFSVVAEEMQKLSETTSAVADAMATATAAKINRLLEHISNHIRGTRLSDIALTNIDLVDRCLYERTCDVRWWATDASIIEALTNGTRSSIQYASDRMKVILGAYTVYFDLVLCNDAGTIVANGRPDRFHSCGRVEQQAPWFKSAMASQSGDEYGFQAALESPLVDQQPTLIYSAAVRNQGQSTGQRLGALGVLFNWQGLIQAIFQQMPVEEDEKRRTICFIVDSKQQVIASSRSTCANSRLNLEGFEKVLANKKGHFRSQFEGQSALVAYAESPGFETYRTGWYSIIVQFDSIA